MVSSVNLLRRKCTNELRMAGRFVAVAVVGSIVR